MSCSKQRCVSQITDAFSELYAAQTEVTGETITASFTVAGTVGVVIGGSTFDEALYDGGTGENGEISVQALASDFDDVQPAKFSACTLQGVARKVLDVQESHGVYVIRLGDPVTK